MNLAEFEAYITDPKRAGRTYELIEGRAVLVGTPEPEVTAVAQRLRERLAAYALEKGAFIAAAGTAFRLTEDTVRVPTVGVIGVGCAVDNGGRVWHTLPQLAIEVSNPGACWFGETDRFAAFLDAGTRLAWVINVEEDVIDVYRLHEDGLDVTSLQRGDSLTGGDVLPGFVAPVDEVLGASPAIP